MSERTPPPARRVLAALPDRPVSIWEYNTLTMGQTAPIPPQLDRPIHDFRKDVPTDQLADVGGVVCKKGEWVEKRAGIIGFRFWTEQSWVTVGFEPETGWSILRIDETGNQGLSVIDDRITTWAETFYEDTDIDRLHVTELCAGSGLALLPREPVSEEDLTGIFSDTIYQGYRVEITVRPLATEVGTGHILAFQLKVRLPDRDNWVFHGSVHHRTSNRPMNPGYWYWGASDLDKVTGVGSLSLEGKDREIALALEGANLNYWNNASLEVPLPADWAQAVFHILVRLPGDALACPCDASVFTDASETAYGLRGGEALVALNGTSDPREQTILGYHDGTEKRVYSGYDPTEGGAWRRVVTVDKTAGTGPDRPAHVTATLEEWLNTHYGDHPDARRDLEIVPLVQWEPNMTDLFATPPLAKTRPSVQTSTPSTNSLRNDPEAADFINQLAAETGVDRAKIVERYQELKSYKVPDREAKRATRVTFTKKTPYSDTEGDAHDSRESADDRASTSGFSGFFSWLRE